MHIVTWWIERNSIVVLELDCDLHQRHSRVLCEIAMKVTNKGRRALKLSVARFTILKGPVTEEAPNLIFPDFINASAEERNQLRAEGSMIWREPLPQMTAKRVVSRQRKN